MALVEGPTVGRRRLSLSQEREARTGEPRRSSVLAVDWRALVPSMPVDRIRRRGSWLGRRLAIVVGLLVLAVVGLMAGVQLTHTNRVYPAVHAASLDLGGLTREEARAALQGHIDDLEQGTVRLTYQGKTWEPTLRELGARYDIATTLERAYSVGRGELARDRVGALLGLARQDETIPFAMTFDQGTFNSWLDTVDRDLGEPPHDAYLAIENESVTIVPEVDGTVVDRTAAATTILSTLRAMQPVETDLPVVTKETIVRAADLEQAAERLRTALSRPVPLSYGQGSWSLTGAELSAFVVQRIDPTKRGAEAHVMSLDQAKLAIWLLERIGPDVEREPVNAVVGWNEGPVALEPSVEGITLRAKELAQLVEAQFFGNHAPIILPVTITQPEVNSNNLGSLGITTRLARGDSYYGNGSADRNTNVEIGTKLLNHTLIPPHATFSLNAAIGEITADKGYVESQVVEAERAGRDIGGGICQVSTTVFRAALLAGVPIVEWWPHTYRLRGYEVDGWGPGYDASILQVGPDPANWGDFKFENPTDSWMLVESWTVDGYVVVNLYGPDLGYKVEFSETSVSEPLTTDEDIEVVNPELDPGTIEQTEWPIDGFEVEFVRSVYDRNGELLYDRKFYTRFRERANVYQVSPDMEGESPASI